MKRIIAMLFVGVFLFSGVASATLVNYGNGLIYDEVLGITWLQNANLAASETFGVSGIEANGRMNWHTATDWIAAMNAENYLGFSDWRLPESGPVNGVDYDYNYSVDGSTDYAYNISAPGSAYPNSTSNEMNYMWYVNLGNIGVYNVAGEYKPTGWGLQNTKDFENVMGWVYWSGTEYLPDTDKAFDLDFRYGAQSPTASKLNANYHVWAVRDGAPVPEPTTMLLLGTGLIGLAGARRKLRL